MSAASEQPNDTLLYLEGVSVTFDGFKAINDLNLYVRERELRSVIGPNGAGKSTMMDIITGRTRPDRGRVIFGYDIDLTALDEPSIAELGIGRKFQQPTVFVNHTVWENLELALASDRSVWANLTFRITPEQADRIDEVLRLIALESHARRLAGELSHGQKQWLEIGMLLMQDPKLLLIDEPVAGMTGQETDRTAELLRDLSDLHAVLVVEHDMTFVRSLSCKTTVLHQGGVIAEGPMEQVQADPRVIEVYLGD